jgi:mannose-6-phosphate isomerase-like protein (cupin superfamily)
MTASPEKIDVKALAAEVSEDWKNWVVGEVNDHVIRVSVLTRDFHWHSHSNSDETFLALEGGLYVDFKDRTVALEPGQMLTVLRSTVHRTRPMKERAVTLTFEHRDADVKGDGAEAQPPS